MRRNTVGSLLIVALAAVLGGIGPARPGLAQQAYPCFGLTPTIVQVGGVVTGTGGADVIVAADVSRVDGLGGNDTICVGRWAGPLAVIDGGSGNDHIHGCWFTGLIDESRGVVCAAEGHGGSGADTVERVQTAYGDSGDDLLLANVDGYGGPGNDRIVGSAPYFESFCDGGSGRDEAWSCVTTRNVP